MNIADKLQSIKIRKDRLLLLGVIVLVSYLIYFFLLLFVKGTYKVPIFLLLTLTLILFSYFFLKRDFILFEPFTVFSAYYFTIIISGIYFLSAGFESNNFIRSTIFSKDLDNLFNLALLYSIIGYVSALLGYYLFRKSNSKIEIIFDSNKSSPEIIIKFVVFLFLLIGILNFAYNIYTFSGGRVLMYLKNFAMRSYEFEEKGGTTLGYIFAYTAMYVWFFRDLRRSKISKSFYIFLVITFIMKASSGRILDTILYLLTFMLIYYFVTISREKKIRNKKYIILFSAGAFTAIILYFLRIWSNYLYLKMSVTYDLSTFLDFFSKEQLNFYLIEKGNLPNIPILMKIIDSWNHDIGFLYGKSLFSWILNILPSSIRPEGYQPSVMIKETWYTHIQSGNLPPTGIGEMYANFGVLGPILGMFLFGVFCAFLYNYLLRTKNFWVLVIYSQIILYFILIYAKGEFDNLSLWLVLPILITLLLIKILKILSIKNINET